LCDQPLRNTSASNTTTSTNVTVSNSDSSANDTSVPVATTSVANAATSKRIVLLQTARAVATNESGTASQNVRLLFHNGSQRSYITDSLKTKLNLEPLNQEKLNLNTFGNSGFKSQRCDIVNVWLQPFCSSESVCIDVLCFPTLCSPISSEIDLSKYPCLSELDLADYAKESSHNTMDILVGSEFYWTFVAGEIVKTDKGPVAIGSKLGWLL